MEAKMIAPETLHRLDVQGLDHVPVEELAPVAPWLRLPYALCALIATTGVVMGSPMVLWGLVPVALLAAILPVHPFDLLYNHAIRYMTGTGPFPRRGTPARFACGMGSLMLVATGWAFHTGHTTAGLVIGGQLAVLASLVAITNICVPSILFRKFYGPPKRRAVEGADWRAQVAA